jgi:hypothetical protein
MAVLNGASCMEYKNRNFACASLVYSYHTNGVYVFAYSAVSNWLSCGACWYTYNNSQTLVLDVGTCQCLVGSYGRISLLAGDPSLPCCLG